MGKAQMAYNLEMLQNYMNENLEYFLNEYPDAPAKKQDSLLEATREILERELEKQTKTYGYFFSKREFCEWVDNEMKDHKHEMIALADEYDMDYD